MDKKLFYLKQFGVRSKLSSIHALPEMISDNSNLNVPCILLDLQKAFDTIKHKYLEYKLEAYVVTRVCLD